MTEKALLSHIFNFSDAYRKLLNNPFATVKNICYFNRASKKLGAGISLPFLRRGTSSYLVMVDCLGRSIGSAVSLCSGKANPLWSATIRLASDGGGRKKLIHRGAAMNRSWCLLGGICHRISYAFFNRVVHGFFGLKGAVL